jgi:two-component system KDP operon response regulator KdpE
MAKILVIEDDRPTLLALKYSFKLHGHEVIAAVDAISAVALAAREHPDLVLTDIGLPCGDGFSVMARIHALLPMLDTPIIVLTSRDDPASEQHALAAGAAAFFTKPANLDAICAAVASLLSPRGMPELVA